MSRFSPCVLELPQQGLRNRDMFVANFGHGAKDQNSAIVHCQKQLNDYTHNQSSSTRAREREKEARWREWMADMEERISRRREEQASQEGWEGGG